MPSEGDFLAIWQFSISFTTFLFLRAVSRLDAVVERFFDGFTTDSSISVVGCVAHYDESWISIDGIRDVYIYSSYFLHHLHPSPFSLLAFCKFKSNNIKRQMANNLRHGMQSKISPLGLMTNQLLFPSMSVLKQFELTSSL